jgi:hypothetical protein
MVMMMVIMVMMMMVMAMVMVMMMMMLLLAVAAADRLYLLLAVTVVCCAVLCCTRLLPTPAGHPADGGGNKRTRTHMHAPAASRYVYYNTPAPWLQVKLFKILQHFPAPTEATLRDKLMTVLHQIMDNTTVTKSVNKNNTDYSILFEAVNFIIHLADNADPELQGKAVELLGQCVPAARRLVLHEESTTEGGRVETIGRAAIERKTRRPHACVAVCARLGLAVFALRLAAHTLFRRRRLSSVTMSSLPPFVRVWFVPAQSAAVPAGTWACGSPTFGILRWPPWGAWPCSATASRKPSRSTRKPSSSRSR